MFESFFRNHFEEGEKDKSLASAATDECGSRFPNVEALWRAAGDVVPLFRTLFHKSFTKSQQSILRSPDLTALREDELTSYTLRIKREFGRYWATVLIPTWNQLGHFRKSGFYFFCSLWWLVFSGGVIFTVLPFKFCDQFSKLEKKCHHSWSRWAQVLSKSIFWAQLFSPLF